MDVLAGFEGLFQGGDVGDVGEEAEFDLAVVATDEDVAGFGDEGAADAAAFFGSDGDVLEVGVG